MAERGSIAPVQSQPGGVVHLGTPGGGLMKSKALKRVRNPGDRSILQPRYPEAVNVEKAFMETRGRRDQSL
jgi:hypothetical protein